MLKQNLLFDLFNKTWNRFSLLVLSETFSDSLGTLLKGSGYRLAFKALFDQHLCLRCIFRVLRLDNINLYRQRVKPQFLTHFNPADGLPRPPEVFGLAQFA
jgi:hypothetical protein